MEFVLGLPLWCLFTYAFGLGVIIGSFLNVFLYRFHTGKSLSGSSHCLSCQKRLVWYELVPLLSYLFLKGRCRTCSASIPSRYLWVELTTGLLFGLVVLTEPLPWLWPVLAVLVATLVLVTVYDLYHMVIPSEFVWMLLVLSFFLIGHDWYWQRDAFYLLGRLVGAAAAFMFFAGLWRYSEGRWIGFGDAKLVIPLALIVGGLGTFSMIVLAFWLGTFISLTIILVAWLWQKRGQSPLRFMTKPLTIKSEVPFAPFLIMAFVLVYFIKVDILSLVSYALPY